MTAIVIPAPTIEEQEAEDFDPIPCIAPAFLGEVQQPFQLALPSGDGRFSAAFDDWPVWGAMVSHCAVRYSELLPPTFLRFREVVELFAGDTLVIHVKPGAR